MTVAAVSLSRSRRWLARIDGRVVGGIALVAISVVGGLRLVGEERPTTTVLVASDDLPTGHRVVPGDLRAAELDGSRAVLSAMVAGAPADVVGRVLARPVGAGEPLPRAALADGPAEGREVTIPVAPEHALGGALTAGERVDVLATFGAGTEDARTLTIVTDVEVVSAARDEGLFADDGATLTALTLRVPDADAVFLVFAARNGEIDVLRAGSDGDLALRADLSDVP